MMTLRHKWKEFKSEPGIYATDKCQRCGLRRRWEKVGDGWRWMYFVDGLYRLRGPICSVHTLFQRARAKIMDKKEIDAFWAERAPIPSDLEILAKEMLDQTALATMIAQLAANYLRRQKREEKKEAQETARSVREVAVQMLRLMPAHAPEGSVAYEGAMEIVIKYMEAWAARQVEVKRIGWSAKLGILYSHLHSMGNATGVQMIMRHLYELQAPPDQGKLSGLP